MKELTCIVSMLLLSSCLFSCKSELKVPQKNTPKEIINSQATLDSPTEPELKGDESPQDLSEDQVSKELKEEDKLNTIIEETTRSTKESLETKEVSPNTQSAPVAKTVIAQKTEKITSHVAEQVIHSNPIATEPELIETPTEVVPEPLNDLKEQVVADMPEVTAEESSTPPVTIDMHKEWDYILRTYVSPAGKVDYAGIVKEKNRLEGYLALISNNPPSADWARNKKLAYWINAYNAYTVKMIIDNYPLESITDLEGGKPWDKKWIKIGAQSYSLNNIENDIIRPDFNEPRIHFAVNCAANSCPPLRNEAWTAAKLEQQLESSTKKFVNNSAYNTIGNGQAKVSKVFEWYAADFKDLKGFLKEYSGKAIDNITYKEYDWSLNK